MRSRPVVTIDGMPSVRNPIAFSSTPPTYRLPPPQLGQHSDEIRDWLA